MPNRSISSKNFSMNYMFLIHVKCLFFSFYVTLIKTLFKSEQVNNPHIVFHDKYIDAFGYLNCFLLQPIFLNIARHSC